MINLYFQKNNNTKLFEYVAFGASAPVTIHSLHNRNNIP